MAVRACKILDAVDNAEAQVVTSVTENAERGSLYVAAPLGVGQRRLIAPASA